MAKEKIRVLLTKIGIDVHDLGIKNLALMLREKGMEVIYTGLWQTVEAVVRAVEDEDAEALGISLLSGAHMTLIPALVNRLRDRDLEDVVLVVGGIIPDSDIPSMEAGGIQSISMSGSSRVGRDAAFGGDEGHVLRAARAQCRGETQGRGAGSIQRKSVQ